MATTKCLEGDPYMRTIIMNNEEQNDGVSEHDVIFANLVKAVVSGIVSREAQQLPCLFC